MLRDFKSYTAKILLKNILENPLESRKNWLELVFKYEAKHQSMNATYMFWQKTSFPIELTNWDMFEQKMNYIHQNPVVSGVVTDASYYNYSSANPLSELKMNVY